MLGQIPALEFWVSGLAIIAAATFLFATGLWVVGLKAIEGGGLYKAALFALAFLAAAQWWLSAQQEEEKVRPGRDYVGNWGIAL